MTSSFDWIAHHARTRPEGIAQVDLASDRSATIINHCREHLARFKVPQSVAFIDEIPHNATGKVLRRVLRESHGA